MKLLLPLLSFAIVAAARPQQTPLDFLNTLPSCAAPCLQNAVTSATTCSVTDSKCFCDPSNYQDIYTAALNCVLTGCGAAVALNEVVPAAENFCTSVLGPGWSATPSSGAAAPENSAPPSATSTATTTAAAAYTAAASTALASGSFASGSFATVLGTVTAQAATPAAASPISQTTNAANHAEVRPFVAVAAAAVVLAL